MNECPVCKRPDLAAGLPHCPQCNADLECFDLLNALQDKPAVVEERPSETVGPTEELPSPLPPEKSRSGRNGLIAGLALVLLIVLIPLTTFIGNRYLDERIQQLEKRLTPTNTSSAASPPGGERLYIAMQTLGTRMEEQERLLADLILQRIDATKDQPKSRSVDDLAIIKEWMPQIEAQLAHLNQQQEAIQKVLAAAPTAQLTTVSALVEKEPVTSQPGEPSTTSALPVVLTPAATPTFTVYHAAPTETLWRIAQRFYGKGNYYPVLLEDNPGLTIHGSPDSRNLRIASQLEHVKEIYQRLVFSEDGRILFRYQARVGDSWRSLARDFYGNERRTNELTKLHGLSQPEPGQRLAIPLD